MLRERRHDLVLEQAVELLAVGVVGDAVDRPADVGRIALRPPAVEHREVEDAVHAPPSSRSFPTPRADAAACSARRRSRGRASARGRCRSSRGRRSGPRARSRPSSTISCITSLPGTSAGCALPATTIWSGQREQPLDVGEDEAGALVGGEPPGEADRQQLAVDPRALCEARLRRRVDAARARPASDLPRRLPARLVGRRLGSHARVAEELGERGIEPGADVDAVRDVPDRRLPAGPEPLPHLARDLAVQCGDRRSRARRGGARAASARSRAPRLPRPSASSSSRPRPASSASGADVADDELLVEDLVPGRHGCVGGEDRGAANVLERRGRLHPAGDERHARARSAGTPNGPRSGGRRSARSRVRRALGRRRRRGGAPGGSGARDRRRRARR